MKLPRLAPPSAAVLVTAADAKTLRERIQRVAAETYGRSRLARPVAFAAVGTLSLGVLALAGIAFSQTTVAQKVLAALPQTVTQESAEPKEGEIVAKLISVQRQGKFWAPDGGSTTDCDLQLSPGDTKLDPYTFKETRVRLKVTNMDPERIFVRNPIRCTIGGVSGSYVGDDPADVLIEVQPKPGAKTVGFDVGYGTPFQVYKREFLSGFNPSAPVLGRNQIWTPVMDTPPDIDLRLIVITIDGKEHDGEPVKYNGTLPPDSRAQPDDLRNVWTLPDNIERSKVKELLFCKRSVRWEHYRNIHLYPNRD